MVRCPLCGDEFDVPLPRCPDCGVPLEGATSAADHPDSPGSASHHPGSPGSALYGPDGPGSAPHHPGSPGSVPHHPGVPGPAPHAAGRPARPPTHLLGRFHPAVADAVSDWLTSLRVPHERLTAPDTVEVRIRGGDPERLRAELVLVWSELIRSLDPEVAFQLLADEGDRAVPGWRDAPRGAWVDRDGELRVEAEDATSVRTVGPALVVVGVLMALLGWFAETQLSPLLLVAGIATTIGGLLLPR